MKKKEKLLAWVILFLLVINICATGGVIIYLSESHMWANSSFSESEQAKCYTIYIGTNDKDTYTQLISLEEAKETVNKICAKYADGYTVKEADGGWVDETGTLTEEQTLVYSFTNISEEALTSIMDEVLKVLNQNSILVETSNVYSRYYSGK